MSGELLDVSEFIMRIYYIFDTIYYTGDNT